MIYVWMRHPNLEALINVPESAAGHHAMSGWEICDPPPPPPKPAQEPVADAAGSAVETEKPARRRRGTQEGDS